MTHFCVTYHYKHNFPLIPTARINNWDVRDLCIHSFIQINSFIYFFPVGGSTTRFLLGRFSSYKEYTENNNNAKMPLDHQQIS